MKRTMFFLLLLVCGGSALRAVEDYRMDYTLSFDTVGHYISVSLDYIPTNRVGESDVVLKMPVWAPGYYQIVDFPKYLTDFTASSANGAEVHWTKKGKNAWHLHAPGADTLHVAYRVYARMRSVVESRVESEIAFVAPNGVFMHCADDVNHPVNVRFVLPSNWNSISTGLPQTDVPGCYRADDFDQLYDSPFLVGNPYTLCFEHEGHDYEFALETPDGFEESPLLDDFKRMVSATTRLMGDVPYTRYCLMHMGKGLGGLEHRNSQACYTDGSFRFDARERYLNYMGFVTHEYFHLYNVKSIRPIELGPFDYDREVFTPLLWVSEGFTVYYETQLMLRAGIIDVDYLLNDLSEYIRDTETNEGQKHMSLRQSSYDIWLNFLFRAENSDEVRISYYVKGPVLGLVFDAALRTNTQGEASIDDLMRLLYNRYYRQLDRGFSEEEFWETVAEVASTGGNEQQGRAVAERLRRLTDTTTPVDYESVLTPVGLKWDTQTLTLRLLPNPTRQAARLRQAMLGV